MHLNNFENVIVLKPWGYEFLLFENKNLSIWILYLEHEKSTSFHCHSKKLTGLVSLIGKIKVSFFENFQIIEPLKKVMIRQRLFHSSQSLSEEGSFLLEVETPSEKNDLIRLSDSHGREGLPYETIEKYRERSNEIFIKENEEGIFKVCDKNIEIKSISNKEEILEINDEDVLIILEGCFLKNIKNNSLSLLSSGDCLYGAVYKKIFSSIDEISDNTKIMIISKL